MNQLLFRSAAELAAGIRERRWSSTEVVEAHLEQINRHNAALHAIATLDAAGARERAREADAALVHGEVWGPLHGVPITIKDVFETRGLRTTCSYKPLANYVPTRDATVVARLRDAGAVLLGKTNVPLLAIDVQTLSPLFGRANNPWNVECTPGGSTGGGGAAVAAGMTPFDMASDLAGSIRIPAHFCGVYGFKPTEHSVSTHGHIPELPGVQRGVRHMLCAGPIARSVEDLRLAFRITAGADGRHWEVPPFHDTEVARKPLREYRFAWSDDFPGLPISADTRKAMADLVEKLTRHGCRVERRSPPNFDFEEACETFAQIAAAEVGATLPAVVRLITKLQFRMMPGASPIKTGLLRGARLSMRRFAKSLTRRDSLTMAFERFLADWDAWLVPVSAINAFPHWRQGRRFSIEGQAVNYLMGTVGITCLFNMTGSPVVAAPIGLPSTGLPMGVQIVGRRWQDLQLLAVAEALAEVTGSCPCPPGYNGNGK